MVLSGNSPMKMIGKTATTMAKFTATFLAGPIDGGYSPSVATLLDSERQVGKAL
jgi:hypothetical protein